MKKKNSLCPCLLQNQQHDIEVQIETQKSHRKHFETRLKDLQDSIKKAEKEHETMKKLVRVSVQERKILKYKCEHALCNCPGQEQFESCFSKRHTGG